MPKTFSSIVEQEAEPLRKAIQQHSFIVGIGDGSLEEEIFKFYIRQDYLYLIEYSRVLAVASARSPDLETMAWFASLLHTTLTTELAHHTNYCAQFGISEQDLRETQMASATTEYTKYLLDVAYNHAFPVLVAALVPCQWGYWEIGNQLNKQEHPKNSPLYSQWIQMYSSGEFKALAHSLRNLIDRLAQSENCDGVNKMKAAYLKSLRHEYRFWDMSYNQER